MLRTFIFDKAKSHWVEEEHSLLLNDICIILDEEKEPIIPTIEAASKKAKFFDVQSSE